MTIITVVAGRDMRQMFAGRSNPVVARTTSTKNLGMVDSISRRKYVRVVTVFANVRRLYMCRSLAHRIDAVMTAGTVINDSKVIEIRRTPGNR